jgi:hypothetical protein
MAKKTVATLQTASKRLSKAIKMVKSPKTGAYTFVESIMSPEAVDEFLKKKSNASYIDQLLSFGSSFFILYLCSGYPLQVLALRRYFVKFPLASVGRRANFQKYTPQICGLSTAIRAKKSKKVESLKKTRSVRLSTFDFRLINKKQNVFFQKIILFQKKKPTSPKKPAKPLTKASSKPKPASSPSSPRPLPGNPRSTMRYSTTSKKYSLGQTLA